LIDSGALDSKGWCTTPLLDADEVAALRGRWDALGIPDDRPMLVSSVDCPRTVARAVDLDLKAALADAVERLLPDAEPFLAAFISKGTSGGWVDLHQDWTYHDERRGRAILLWCPLVDVDAGTGTLHVVDRSHRWSDGLRGSGSAAGLAQDVQDELWRIARPVPLRAGEAIVYDAALIHGSTPTGGALRPVVAIATVPKGASLVHFHQADDEPLQGYAVDEDWFTTAPHAVVPDDAAPVAGWAPPVAPLDAPALEHLLLGVD
jgi:hypothetical protein